MGEQEIMEQAITGSILIADDQYPYSYDKETEKLTLYIGGKTISVPEDTMSFVGQKYGVLNGGRFLYKLDLPFSNDCMGFENGQPKYFSLANQVRSVEYYIENYEAGSRYKEMRLRFPELDYFIPSRGRVTVSEMSTSIGLQGRKRRRQKISENHFAPNYPFLIK